MTGLDWGIIAFALTMGLWGYRQGFLIGLVSVGGFLAGAMLGSRVGPALLVDGSESPYAPFTALAGALLLGGFVAIVFEGAAWGLRPRLLTRRATLIADDVGGAVLLAGLGLGLAWIAGAVALNAPGAEQMRESAQRSVILRALNDALPPSGFVLNALNRVDPGVEVEGPDPDVGPPDAQIADDLDVAATQGSVVRVTGTACGLGVEGSGWAAGPRLVVTNAHVVAGEDDTTVDFGSDDEQYEATVVHYDTANDLALLRVDGIVMLPLPMVPEPQSGTTSAVLGFPENGPFAISPARLGPTHVVLGDDSYGRGPVPRELTSLRGRVRSGNSGGPVVDEAGRVLATIYASTTGGAEAGGYAVPNSIVADALDDGDQEVSTGPCI